ncbi:MAG TPA: BTAD domain-containing putative transcriptional regulator, partial [Chloroflexota bacterium]|nr:BTAD domain-containing putative transcriptional regulator [Chloroflexota bacterium]
MSVLEINLLGVPEVRRGGAPCKIPTGKTLALLAYLAVEGGLHPREEVVAMLWPEAGEQEGRASLRGNLTVLRKALGEQRGTHEALRTVGNAIGLEPTAVAVDVQTLASAAAGARQHEAPPGMRVQLERAVAVARGPLLAGISLAEAPDFEVWLLARRAGSHRHLSEALAHLASLQEATGDLPAAVTTLERWVRHDPLEEQAHQRLLAAHAATGDVAAGLHAYEACRAVLAAELGTEPNLDIQAQAEQLQAAAHHPLSLPARHALGVGVALEPPLVGRASELVALHGCYAEAQAGRAQVVVVTGEMGSGKTRLLSEFLAGVRAQDVEVLCGQAFGHGDSLPYAAVVEALRPRLERENALDDLLDDLWLAELA